MEKEKGLNKYHIYDRYMHDWHMFPQKWVQFKRIDKQVTTTYLRRVLFQLQQPEQGATERLKQSSRDLIAKVLKTANPEISSHPVNRGIT